MNVLLLYSTRMFLSTLTGALISGLSLNITSLEKPSLTLLSKVSFPVILFSQYLIYFLYSVNPSLINLLHLFAYLIVSCFLSC